MLSLEEVKLVLEQILLHLLLLEISYVAELHRVLLLLSEHALLH